MKILRNSNSMQFLKEINFLKNFAVSVLGNGFKFKILKI